MNKQETFWQMIKRVAARTRNMPAWMSAGINICRTRYVTYSDEPCPYTCCKKPGEGT